LVGDLRRVFEAYYGCYGHLSIWLGPPEILLRAGNSILQEAEEAGHLIGTIGTTLKVRSLSEELLKRSDRSGDLTMNRQEVE
jgi:hypothetical protein